MQQKTFNALAATTALVATAATVLALTEPQSGPGPAAGRRVLPELAGHAGDAASLELWHGGRKVTIKRQSRSPAPEANRQWGIAEKQGFPADPARLRQTLLGLSELTLVEAKTARPDLYPRLDLEEPTGKDARSTLVRVTDGKGAVLAELILGKRRPDRLGSGKDGIYIRRPGEQGTWLAQGTLDLGEDATDWMDRKVASIAADRIREASFVQADGTRLTLTRGKPDEDLGLAGAPADTKYAPNDARAEVLRMFDPFEIADARPASGAELPKTAISRAEWRSFDGLILTVTGFDGNDTHWVRLAASGEGPAAAGAERLNAQWSGWLYAVPAYKAGIIRTRRADILEPPESRRQESADRESVPQQDSSATEAPQPEKPAPRPAPPAHRHRRR